MASVRLPEIVRGPIGSSPFQLAVRKLPERYGTMKTFALIVQRKTYRSRFASWLIALICAVLLNGCAIMPAGEILHPGRFELEHAGGFPAF
jgi:hypothetical protein